ncbi:MAG TPA: type II toxin-antitoxin system prevent-host-death family antitoxin [Terracidiphilus sp.]|nr:type II toxin-antitoxin system prevent-host-death family antitoxin [Terracidiphilus sp.]
MHKATMFEAKTNLSALVRRAQKGEEVVITSGRARKPVARLVAVEPPRTSRRIGFLKGQGNVGPEFFEPLPADELSLWNGEGE